MSLLLLFVGGHRGGHFYQEHPSRKIIREREKQEAEYAARQLEEGRKKRAEQAARREEARVRQLVQDALHNRISIDMGRDAVADAANDLLLKQQAEEDEAVVMLLLT